MRLFLAAMPRELTGFLKRCRNLRREALPVHRAWSGLFQGRPMLAIANGAGPRRAYLAVAGPDLEMVCNVGFCGALAPALRIGDLVIATAVNGQKVCRPQSEMAAFAGPLASVDYVARTVDQKRALQKEGGAVAVEMEAAGALKRAQELGVPFYAVRAVSDLAGETLCCDFNRALRDDGSIDVAQLALQAVTHPFTCLPELLRLRKRAVFASECLGEFLATCNF